MSVFRTKWLMGNSCVNDVIDLLGDKFNNRLIIIRCPYKKDKTYLYIKANIKDGNELAIYKTKLGGSIL